MIPLASLHSNFQIEGRKKARRVAPSASRYHQHHVKEKIEMSKEEFNLKFIG